MFTDEFLDQLPSDPEKASFAMCKYFFSIHSNIPETEENDRYDDYIDAFAAIEAFIEARGLPFTVPEIGSERGENINIIVLFFERVLDELDKKILNSTHSDARDKFKKRFGTVFLYQFSEGDLKRIQGLINELRDLLVGSELFDTHHKERILKKLENLQAELHKKVSTLDNLWGLMGDAGVALGKFGKDAKPFVDRIREIVQITWRTQVRAEELPSGTTFPLLTGEKQEEADE